MSISILPMPLAWWMDLEYMTGWQAGLMFLVLAAPIVLLGMRSLAGLDRTRKWVAIGLRLLVVLLLILTFGGARWQRQHKNVELLVLRDISDSTSLFRAYPGKNLQESIDDFLHAAAEEKHKKSKDDRIGVISFSGEPRIDWIPSTALKLDARAIRERGEATDIASALQLALATFQRNAMRRMLLISDGNTTRGDLETALAAAISQRIPIDVMKLSYAVSNEVLIDRVAAPAWKKEGDPFDIFVSLLSTNLQPVTGTLEVLEEGQPLARKQVTLSPATLNPQGKLEPRKHVERVHVPALKAGGARRFKAIFQPDVVNSPAAVADASLAADKSKAGDTLLQNNTYSAFTFVRGQGRILYVDNAPNGTGQVLFDALKAEAINVERINVDQVPEDLVQLQGYDAVILNNVPRGRTEDAASGLSDRQDALLASYVHDFGGGLIMIGGPNSFGAGGWQGSKLEEVMPVNFDVPAERQLPKGALVLVIHSCEMPNGNYWGEQCALKAVEALSSMDEVGVISYDWNGRANGGVGGSSWNFPLARKGDGMAVTSAIKRMQPGDMPSFDDCMELALNGNGQPNAPSLKNSNAAQKHVIIISDGDPQQPRPALMAQYQQQKVTVSTVAVYPHGGAVPPTLQNIAKFTGGRYYGPIESNPSKLPQIFIKEATVVRRTLIQERDPERSEPPMPVSLKPNTSDVMKGVLEPPPIWGLVLTQVKNHPSIEMPLVASPDGKRLDPLFAHWQAGLGRVAAFTSGSSKGWDRQWLGGNYASMYGKFWAQMVRSVARASMSRDFAATVDRQGDKATVSVEATNQTTGFTNFLNFRGIVVDPNGKQQDVRLVQTGPGTYTADFATPIEGNYVLSLQYTGPDGKQGWIPAGVAVNDSPETRELKSNDLLLADIAKRTGGRLIPAFDPASADLFSRQGLLVSNSPLPVWDILIPILLGLILLDVACRRIAWDWHSSKKAAAAAVGYVRSFTLTREVEAKGTLDALKRVRDEVAETKFKTEPGDAPPPLPSAKAKFEARAGVEGDITQVVGGATAKPVPPPPKTAQPKGAVAGGGGHTSSLLEAKRRAQQKIREKEQGE